MAVTASLRSSRSLWVLLAMSSLLALGSGYLFVHNLHWGSGLVCSAAALMACRLGLIGRRARRSQREAAQPVSPEARQVLPATEPGAATPVVVDATLHMGWRYREGKLVIGSDVASFIPTEDWRNAGLELALSLFVHRIRVARTEIAATASANLPEELAEMARARGGFVLGDDWTWSRISLGFGSYIWMRRGEREILQLGGGAPQAAVASRWPEVVPAPPAARRPLAILSGVAVALALAGAVAWQATGNVDLLIAGVGWGGVLGIAALGIVWGIRRHNRRTSAQR